MRSSISLSSTRLSVCQSVAANLRLVLGPGDSSRATRSFSSSLKTRRKPFMLRRSSNCVEISRSRSLMWWVDCAITPRLSVARSATDVTVALIWFMAASRAACNRGSMGVISDRRAQDGVRQASGYSGYRDAAKYGPK